MENKIIVVGIGPGSEDYLLPIARKAIDKAKFIVGSKRAIHTLVHHEAVTKYIDKDIAGVYDFIRKNLGSDDVTVLVSGDPGFYSLLVGLRKHFSEKCIQVIPGISSVQLAFARISEPWHDAVLLSMHGRCVEQDKLCYEDGRKLAFLTDAINSPRKIAEKLLHAGWPKESTVWLCEKLSYETENIVMLSLDDAVTGQGFEHCVMVVKACSK